MTGKFEREESGVPLTPDFLAAVADALQGWAQFRKEFPDLPDLPTSVEVGDPGWALMAWVDREMATLQTAYDAELLRRDAAARARPRPAAATSERLREPRSRCWRRGREPKRRPPLEK